jgi:hypothetical protein
LRESEVEKYLTDKVSILGGEVRKLSWVHRSNAPDRFIAYKGVWLVEVKRPGKGERPAQRRERERLEAQGVRCRVLSTLAEVDTFIRELQCPSP